MSLQRQIFSGAKFTSWLPTSTTGWKRACRVIEFLPIRVNNTTYREEIEDKKNLNEVVKVVTSKINIMEMKRSRHFFGHEVVKIYVTV